MFECASAQTAFSQITLYILNNRIAIITNLPFATSDALPYMYGALLIAPQQSAVGRPLRGLRRLLRYQQVLFITILIDDFV